jgi:hypothetical protein
MKMLLNFLIEHLELLTNILNLKQSLVYGLENIKV